MKVPKEQVVVDDNLAPTSAKKADAAYRELFEFLQSETNRDTLGISNQEFSIFINKSNVYGLNNTISEQPVEEYNMQNSTPEIVELKDANEFKVCICCTNWLILDFSKNAAYELLEAV